MRGAKCPPGVRPAEEGAAGAGERAETGERAGCAARGPRRGRGVSGVRGSERDPE